MRISWKSLAPIFADVVVSPWNLLVGGLLIKFLTPLQAFFSLLIGYSILGLVFILYGGLGFKYKKESSEIFSDVFHSKIFKIIIPLVLAAGQIGWAAINIELGGRSLASLFGARADLGIIFYTFILICMAALSLHRLGIVKSFVIVSSLGLIIYLLWAKLQEVSFSEFSNYSPAFSRSLFWGVSIVVASLISFSTVTPDFFQKVKQKRDIVLSTLLGMVVPGIMTASLGCFLFFNRSDFDLIPLIAGLTFTIFPNIFNVVTNTDGSVAIYTPALKFRHLFNISVKKGVIVAGIISCFLALYHISAYLEVWLKFLSLFFPIFIGICFPYILFKEYIGKRLLDWQIRFNFVLDIFFAVLLLRFYPPVLISLVLPLILFSSVLIYLKIPKV
ncbi:hypothetical protein A2866_04215 [Candidatus Roizmanbacteria bacterium RIFCSPHIGHO2_01_FULL_39_8]|uniref:Cytosine permease n=2 Tax=Candidatus Roizmaniibacteriota TaxID=1752723 RepID=A0A1F7GTI7_9BACT|nr:MAG: hypothetical protein A2866_04215 [Candidatus Roizmanbacteria bacterium RIFCSPHIGHO2_01_FULL_39_8]OGK27903.1 MAG: hypothetical protein A3C28_04405 [Candidatus Roizmanbacteria bacterium RIFCSPHIGHO2_02_FULL_39_9]